MDNKLKMAVIAGASEALKLNKKMNDEEVMKHIMKNAESIVKKIDVEDF